MAFCAEAGRSGTIAKDPVNKYIHGAQILELQSGSGLMKRSVRPSCKHLTRHVVHLPVSGRQNDTKKPEYIRMLLPRSFKLNNTGCGSVPRALNNPKGCSKHMIGRKNVDAESCEASSTVSLNNASAILGEERTFYISVVFLFTRWSTGNSTATNDTIQILERKIAGDLQHHQCTAEYLLHVSRPFSR